MEFVEFNGQKYYVEYHVDYYVEYRRLKLSNLGILDILEINGLDKLSNLQELYLGGNNIKEIKGLDSLINLKKLRLGGNQITEIKGLDKLKKLQSLRLSGNKITEIQGLESLTSLEYLKLKENPIRKDQVFLLTSSAQQVVNYCRNEIISKYLKEEDQDLEHKESFRWDVNDLQKNKTLKKEVTKAVCAFLNSNAGKVVIGVDDNGNIKGIEPDLKTYNATDFRKARDLLFQDIKKEIREDLDIKIINNINMYFKSFDGKELVIIEIKPSLEPIYLSNDDFIVRDGPASVKLNGKNLGNYIYSHFCLKNTNLNRLFQNFFNLLSRKDNRELSYVLDIVLNKIGAPKVQEVLRMRLQKIEDRLITILKNDAWSLQVVRWEETLLSRFKPSRKEFSFRIPSSNEEILGEYLELIKERCEEFGLTIIKNQENI